ncbi:MAG TPA: VOC family protein [Planctomycetota bacterium]|nr:VOC family protein [Planctomycetota bacterium]
MAEKPSNQYPIAVSLTARDVKKSIAFYRDKLGFELKESWPDPENPMWASLLLDRQSVMLGAMMSPEAAEKMCGGDAGAASYMKTLAEEFRTSKPGVGTLTYIQVPDIDAYHKKITAKGVQASAPKTQFYGIREVPLQDPDGYRFMFYTTVQMESCGSCGMPLKDAKLGQMYCGYCTDDAGKLKPYEVVLEGTIQGYFMGMKKMPRKEAEKAAREHLAKMPAWVAKK